MHSQRRTHTGTGITNTRRTQNQEPESLTHEEPKIKQFYSVAIQQQHTIISTLVWLHVSVLSRPSSGQSFPVEGTIGAHYTLWDPILFTRCA